MIYRIHWTITNNITGWIAVQRGTYINYDLENSPLQIRTDSLDGSTEQVGVFFRTGWTTWVGAVYFYFTSPPKYWIGSCSASQTNFPTALPTETDKIWTVKLSKTSGTVSIVIYCNNKEVLNVVLSDTTCSQSDWSEDWRRDVDKIEFSSKYDNASDYYRPGNYMMFRFII